MVRRIAVACPLIRRTRGEAERGFTLIEVMIAMVLLAIALLTTAVLAGAAIRSVALAERNSRAAALATHYLEEALLELRQDRLPAQLSCTLDNGDQLARVVDLTNPNLPVVSVTVAPEPRGSTPRPLTLTSASFTPVPLTGTPPDATCPP